MLMTCPHWSLVERPRANALATPASGPASLLLPGLDPVAVHAGGSPQLQLRVKAGRAGPGHQGEKLRAQLAGCGLRARRVGADGAWARRIGTRSASARRIGAGGAWVRRVGAGGAWARRIGARGASARGIGTRGASARGIGTRSASARRIGTRSASARSVGAGASV
jgi:hypothetical protein